MPHTCSHSTHSLGDRGPGGSGKRVQTKQGNQWFICQKRMSNTPPAIMSINSTNSSKLLPFSQMPHPQKRDQQLSRHLSGFSFAFFKQEMLQAKTGQVTSSNDVYGLKQSSFVSLLPKLPKRSKKNRKELGGPTHRTRLGPQERTSLKELL